MCTAERDLKRHRACRGRTPERNGGGELRLNWLSVRSLDLKTFCPSVVSCSSRGTRSRRWPQTRKSISDLVKVFPTAGLKTSCIIWEMFPNSEGWKKKHGLFPAGPKKKMSEASDWIKPKSPKSKSSVLPFRALRGQTQQTVKAASARVLRSANQNPLAAPKTRQNKTQWASFTYVLLTTLKSWLFFLLIYIFFY